MVVLSAKGIFSTVRADATSDALNLSKAVSRKREKSNALDADRM